MTETISLGQRLRAVQDRQALDAQDARKRKVAELSLALRQELLAVQSFFRYAKESTELALEFNTLPKPLILGNYYGDFTQAAAAMKVNQWENGKDLSHPDTPYQSQWVLFKAWANDNGLSARFSYQHDGVGLKSWQELEISAL